MIIATEDIVIIANNNYYTLEYQQLYTNLMHFHRFCGKLVVWNIFILKISLVCKNLTVTDTHEQIQYSSSAMS